MPPARAVAIARIGLAVLVPECHLQSARPGGTSRVENGRELGRRRDRQTLAATLCVGGAGHYCFKTVLHVQRGATFHRTERLMVSKIVLAAGVSNREQHIHSHRPGTLDTAGHRICVEVER